MTTCSSDKYFDKGGTDSCQPCQGICRLGTKLMTPCQRLCGDYYNKMMATTTDALTTLSTPIALTTTPATSTTPATTPSLTDAGILSWTWQWGLIVISLLALFVALASVGYFVIRRRRQNGIEANERQNRPILAGNNSPACTLSKSVQVTGECGLPCCVSSLDEHSTRSSESSEVTPEAGVSTA